MKGYSDVLIGLQYGDEGKARVIDVIAKDYDIIARFNGGPNAGHTIEANDKQIVLHQIPSGIFYPEKILYVGSGCVVNLEKLVAEIEDVKKIGINLEDRLYFSDQATIIQPHHIILDDLWGKGIGTTKNGIGPAYADKAIRMIENRLLNIRLGDLCDDPKYFLDLIEKNLIHTLSEYKIMNVNEKEEIKKLSVAFEKIIPYVQRDTLFLQKLVEKGKKVLFEGAQSIMLDITKGAIPYVTSSNTITGSAYVGGDLSPTFHRKTIGVGKMIMSRVGNGPFISEFGEESEKYCMEDEGKKYNKDVEKKLNMDELLSSNDLFKIGIAFRILGNEYGASTGRPRRTGMLDLVQLSFAIKSNGVNEIFLNKCDMLQIFSQTKLTGIPIVDSYKLDGENIDYVPGSNKRYRSTKPAISYKENFSEILTNLRKYQDLPKSVKKLLTEIEEFTNCKIIGIGVGPKREEYIKLP